MNLSKLLKPKPPPAPKLRDQKARIFFDGWMWDPPTRRWWTPNEMTAWVDAERLRDGHQVMCHACGMPRTPCVHCLERVGYTPPETP